MSDTENICKMKSYRCAGALAFVLYAVRVFCVIVLSLHVCKLFIDGFIIYIYISTNNVHLSTKQPHGAFSWFSCIQCSRLCNYYALLTGQNTCCYVFSSKCNK